MDNKPNPEPLFHLHLDSCKQCRENPFNLCEGGHAALRISVEGRSAVEDLIKTESDPRRMSPLELMGNSPEDVAMIKDVVANSSLAPWGRFL